ncbi:hypothetical protein F5Y08DRAFT_49379 [Xylaria arbuscula]|nr:hypothetical protein F5Y08DRAFT_49379 [Xylaria arbuscula]
MSISEEMQSSGTAAPHSEADQEVDGFDDRQSSVRANHPRQAVIAHTIRNEGGITYVNNKHYHYGAESCWTIQKWLSKSSPIRFYEKHRDTFEVAKKTPDTWKWLLDHPDFKSWRDWQANSDSDEPRRLLCSGILGAGKTVLASVVIEHLRSRSRHGDDICLFIYFDFQHQDRYSLLNIYSSLLAQLVQRRSSFTKETQNAFETWETTNMYPNSVEYQKILIAEIRTIARVYIIIDAIDECQNEGRYHTRSELLESLHSFPSNTHILFTTRPHLQKQREAQAHGHIDVNAKQEDLLQYLHGRVIGHDDLPLLKQRSRETIFSHIVERSKGM